MKKGNDIIKKISVILFIILVMAGIGAAVYLFLHMKTSENNENEIKDEIEYVEPIETDNITYIAETSFDGSVELDPLVFAYPFSKYGFQYICNRDLMKVISEERSQQLQQRASDFVNAYFKLDSNSLITGYMEKEEELKQFISEEGVIDEILNNKKGNIYISDFVMDMANAEVTTEISFITDKCLVYEEMQYYVRGIMEITIYDCRSRVDLSAYFPWKMEKGNTYKVIMDIGLIPDESRKADTYIVSEINFIDFIKKA